MNKIDLLKNRLDLEFGQNLSIYSAILNARWAAPLSVAGLLLSKTVDMPSGIAWSSLVAFVIFQCIDNYRERYEDDLNQIKQRIKSLI